MSVLDQFTQTTDSVDSRLTVADSVYTDVINRLTNAQTRAAGGRSTILTQTQRDALAGEIRGAASAILTAVNTSYRGMYLFSGGQSLTPPYAPGPPISGLPGRRQRAVGRRRPRPRRPGDASTAARSCRARRRPTSSRRSKRWPPPSRPATWPASIRASPTSAQAFDRVTNAQTQIGIELARLPEDRARLVTQQQRRRRAPLRGRGRQPRRIDQRA